MDRYLIIAAVVFSLMVVSCSGGSGGRNRKVASREVSECETKTMEVLNADFRALQESVSKLENLPLEPDGKGGMRLTGRDKMVKPDYLLDPSRAASMVELAQKYRFVSMLRVDAIVARLYDMPDDGYEEACIRLLTEINDSAFLEFACSDSLPSGEQTSRFLDEEYKTGRERFFWESVSSGFIEQLYVCTRDLDRFMSMFDDRAAADVTYNIVLIYEGVSSLLMMNPEMQGLQNVLLPLSVINATCVEELRGQVELLKEDIDNARRYLAG